MYKNGLNVPVAKIKNYRNWVDTFLVLGCALVFAGLLALASPAKKSQAAPATCSDTNGYLFKYPLGPTEVHSIDMVTSNDEKIGEIFGRNINAIGYNPKDNKIYGWDDQNDTFVRVSSDFTTTEELTISGYSGPTSGVVIGDVDDNGHYWQLDGNTWYEIDVSTSTPTLIDTGTPGTTPTGTAGADWAFVPGTNKLYRTMNNGATITIWAFDRTSKTWSNVGDVTNITASGDRVIGANYADPDNHLFASSNGTGNLWQIDLTGSAPFTAAKVGTGEVSSTNDGARCSLAPVPTDYSDAPSTYKTLIGDDGPRHNVIGFDSLDSTAPLMLGTHVDIESDGLPNAVADGDDSDHPSGTFVDDERGVTHIVAQPGTPTALAVPVYVTNDDSQSATLAGWIDLDNDGTFETSERVTVTVPAHTEKTVELTFPSATFTANTYARFRVFSAGDTSQAATNLLPTGPAAGGEVEDVLVQVGSYTVNKTADPAEGSAVGPGQNVTYKLTIENTGTTNLTNLKIQDDLTDVLDDATLEGTPTVAPASVGSASVSGKTLEFTGDITAGQTATVTYAVKIKDAATLSGGANLHNVVMAAHSNCHPDVQGAAIVVDGQNCHTNHPVSTTALPNTGSNVLLSLTLVFGLLGASGATFYAYKLQAARRDATAS